MSNFQNIKILLSKLKFQVKNAPLNPHHSILFLHPFRQKVSPTELPHQNVTVIMIEMHKWQHGVKGDEKEIKNLQMAFLHYKKIKNSTLIEFFSSPYV